MPYCNTSIQYGRFKAVGQYTKNQVWENPPGQNNIRSITSMNAVRLPFDPIVFPFSPPLGYGTGQKGGRGGGGGG